MKSFSTTDNLIFLNGQDPETLMLFEKMSIIEQYHSNIRKSITKMNTIFFYDLGLRNIIYNSFNEPEYKVDNGSLFENSVFQELWRKRCAAGTVKFFRTHIENGRNSSRI